MQTEILIGRRDYWQHVRYDLAYKAHRLWGRSSFGRRTNERVLDHKRRMHKGKLSSTEVAEVTSGQSQEALENRTKRLNLQITDDALADLKMTDPAPMQFRAASITRDVLSRRHIACLANVGARMDILASYLAPQFPKTEFISIDFHDMKSFNSDLPQSSNWSFADGYALDLFESGAVEPEAVVFTSTSVMFNSLELDQYIAALRSAKVLIFNEPWWHSASLNPLTIPLPESIDPDRPLCAGRYGQYHHNYPAKLSRFGFKTTLSRIVPGREGGAYALQVVGER